ncbi:hypothetical protein EYF80_042244 [Liparis tanakae]|uniref:Uncharacterized protein n=1 Tax=Liparis tanakae TaxID=230148 RepID=A0A4Z2G4R3_9TELE|nr:hypothetical protein EYF80_042244 [Liparis tanakae]
MAVNSWREISANVAGQRYAAACLRGLLLLMTRGARAEEHGSIPGRAVSIHVDERPTQQTHTTGHFNQIPSSGTMGRLPLESHDNKKEKFCRLISNRIHSRLYILQKIPP